MDNQNKNDSPNLLPSNLVANETAGRVANSLKVTVVLGLEALIVTVAVMLSMIITNSEETKLTQIRISDLNKSLSALESTEQKLFLIHDRVSKAKDFLADKSTQTGAVRFTSLISDFKEGTKLSNLDVLGDHSTFTLSFASSSDFSKFMTTLMASNFYKQINLLSLNFTPIKGFVVNFETVNN